MKAVRDIVFYAEVGMRRAAGNRGVVALLTSRVASARRLTTPAIVLGHAAYSGEPGAGKVLPQ